MYFVTSKSKKRNKQLSSRRQSITRIEDIRDGKIQDSQQNLIKLMKDNVSTRPDMYAEVKRWAVEQKIECVQAPYEAAGSIGERKRHSWYNY